MIAGRAHLTYCTNVHPGESWAEVKANLERHTTRVKARLAPERPFGLGLRLSARALEQLARPEAFADLRAVLERHGLYVFTLNGFPYGTFHAVPVKEEVYRPDWLEEERLAYSDRLAELLARLLPDGVDGSVSTVPGAYKPRAAGAEAEADIADRLLRHAARLVRLRRETGRTVGLALEPEPCCLIETVAEAVSFFERRLYGDAAVERLAGLCGLPRGEAREALRRHLGVCLDACHAAVEFEDPADAVGALRRAGVPILKVQLSAGLRVFPPDQVRREALRAFADPVYLHQVVARTSDGLVRHADLPEALAAATPAEEWRVHFHVPLFRERLGAFASTRDFLSALLALHAREPISSHLEVETYTWDVLPEEFRREDVAQAVAREIEWVLPQLGGSPPP